MFQMTKLQKSWILKKLMNNIVIITYSVLISYCFALHPYEKHELIKPEWVIAKYNWPQKVPIT